MKTIEYNGGGMKPLYRGLMLSAALMTASPIFAEHIEYHCVRGEGSGAGSRGIRIEYSAWPSRVPCQVVYDKSDEGSPPRVLWDAKSDIGFCESKAQGLMNTLTSAKYSCSVTEDQVGGVANLAATAGAQTRQAPLPRKASPAAVVEEEASVAVNALELEDESREITVMPAPEREPASPPARPMLKGGVEPKSRVDSYLNWLGKAASQGNEAAELELARIKAKGLAVFFGQWDALFASVELDTPARPAWRVESFGCGEQVCRTWLLEESAQRDADGFYTLRPLVLLEGRLNDVLTCVAYGEISKCYQLDKPQPVASYRLLSPGKAEYAVYEYRGGAYVRRASCTETSAAGEPTGYWAYSIDLLDGKQPIRPIAGDGECRAAVLKYYWEKLVTS